MLRDFVENSISNGASLISNQGRSAVEISVEDASLWRFSGISIKGLNLVWPKTQSSESISVVLDKINVRMSILSLVSSVKKIIADIKMYGGYFSGKVIADSKGSLLGIDIKSNDINLGKMSFIEPLVGSSLSGLIRVNSGIKADSSMVSDGQGEFLLEIDKMSYGPGSVKLPMGGFVSSIMVPKINLGKLLASFDVKNGVVQSKIITINEGDIEGDMSLSVNMDSNIMRSRLNGSGWFKINKELVEKTETLKMLYDIIPQLKEALQKDGPVGFALRGSLMRPIFNLQRYVEQ